MILEKMAAWSDLINGIGSIVVALFVVYLLSFFTVIGSLGLLGFLILAIIGFVTALGLFYFFRRL